MAHPGVKHLPLGKPFFGISDAGWLLQVHAKHGGMLVWIKLFKRAMNPKLVHGPTALLASQIVDGMLVEQHLHFTLQALQCACVGALR